MEAQELQLVVNYTTGQKKPISEINTRHLLEIYRGYTSLFYHYYGWDAPDLSSEERITDLIKVELDKREHIPNRKESKVIRQRDAKKLHGSRNKNK